MSSLARHVRLLALLVLLAVSLPMAQPARAQTFTVNSTADTDNSTCPTTCTLREAIRLANENSGPDTIAFNIAGVAPHIINVTSALPILSDGATTINVAPAHSVVLNGGGLAAGTFGLRIRSANNVVRGLVIVGFPGSAASLGGSGIAISTPAATGNVIANNWLGLNADGTTTFGNAFYGVLLDEGASNNLIGGTAAGEGNVITGNLRANVAVEDTDTSSANFISNNQIIGNYIGVNPAGTAVPATVNQNSLEAGVLVAAYARGTLIEGNLIGGHRGNGTNPTAGIVIQSSDAAISSTRHPQDTQVVANDIGVTPTGGNIANRIGIRLSRGALNTIIGDLSDPVGGRNVIGYAEEDGIQIADIAYNVTGTKIVGNYIGIARNGTSLAPIGTAGSASLHNTAIYLGTVATVDSPSPATQIGPANVISAARRFGVRVRSSQNVIKGNFIGTNVAGTATSEMDATASATVGFGFGDSGVWIENGFGNTIGGGAGGDRNVIAAGKGATTGSPAAIVVMPGGGTIGDCGSVTCDVFSVTIQGNYLGVSSSGTAALAGAASLTSEGIRLTNNRTSTSTAAPTGNIVRGNVISGLGVGIYILRGVSNSFIEDNRIGTNAAGALTLAQAIRNQQHGISITVGAGSDNQINGNIIAFNGDDTGGGASNYAGINVDNTSGGGNNNRIQGNRLVGNGDNTLGSGVYVNGTTGILISQTTTSGHNDDGIRIGAGGNNNLAAPTLSAASGTVAAATLTGTSSCNNCTVEVFTSSVNETREGPVYLTSGTTNGSGGFSINITGCQRYLTATVRDASNNTSPFSNSLDSGGTGPCVDSTFTLGAASPNSRQVLLGESTTYIHTLTNNAPVERTFTVVATSSRGWASASAQVTVLANTSVALPVTVSVPYTAQVTPTPDVDTTTVQVFVGSTGSNIVTDTTTARAPANSPAAPAVSPGQTRPRSGDTLSFTHTVTNTGDLAGTFSVAGPSGSGSLPTFVGTPPAGWSIASATLADPNLAGGESTTLTILVNTPAGAAAGSVQFSFLVKADNGNQSGAVTDTITVPAVRGLTFVATSPTGSPPTLSRPPGAAADFVYTLTNTGNATDSFQVPAPAAAAPLSFSVSPSGSFALAAGASRTVTVTAQVAQGAIQGDYNFNVTARTADSSISAPAVAGRVTVTGGGSPQLSFGPGAPNPASASGDTVSFTGTLTNTGNATTPFSLGTPTVTGGPAGWSAAVVAGGTCGAQPISLAAGASCTFTLQVTVPNGANGGPQAVTLSATANNSGQSPPASNVTVNATATVNVAFVRGVSLSAALPADVQVGLPSQVLTFTHTLTNLGNASDSFTLSLSPTPPATAGMAVLSPTSLSNVPRDATRTVTLVVTVPGGQSAGTNLDFTITATSQADASATDSKTDRATVEAFDGASLSPGTNKNGLPGTTLTFTHTLTNTGSTAIEYEIAASNSNGDFAAPAVTSANPTATLNPGQTTTVTVEVQLPTSLPGGTANTTTVEVRKAGGGAVLASASNVSLVGNTYDVTITPNRSGTGYPNASLVFTHTVTNIGVTADTYTLTATNALAWPMGVVPSVLALAPGASQEVVVTIDVPNDDSTLAGAENFGRVVVVSNTSPETSSDQATENITIGKVVELVFTADQARAVTPSSGTIRLRDLVLSNIGNGSDTVDLTVLGADEGWEVAIQPDDFLGARDTNYNVGVSVKVPTTVQPGPTKVITIQARSRFNPAALAEVRLRFVYIAPEVKVTYKLSLPMVHR